MDTNAYISNCELKTIEDLVEMVNFFKQRVLGNGYPITTKVVEKMSFPDTEHDRDWHRYKDVDIPKKSVGVRRISAPKGNLKWIQLALKIWITSRYEPNDVAMGFVKERSIARNASKHCGKRYVFNVDLNNFFPSITFEMVRNRLTAVPYSLDSFMASRIAYLCCEKKITRSDKITPFYVLPQGAPTSPVLSNIVCEKLDERLLSLAQHYGLIYTRYADDITFSSDHDVYHEGASFRQKLTDIIEEEGFSINPKKTRLQGRGERQEVTGIVVSDKINVCRGYLKNIRAWLHIWEKYGYMPAFAKFYPYYKAKTFYVKRALWKNMPLMENVIGGMLQFVKMVRGAEDAKYLKLQNQFDRLSSKETRSRQLTTVPPKGFSCFKYLYSLPKEVFERSFGKIEIKHHNRSLVIPADQPPLTEEAKETIARYCQGTYGIINRAEGVILIGISKNVDLEEENLVVSLCQELNHWPFLLLHKGTSAKMKRRNQGRFIDAKDVPEDMKNFYWILHLAFLSWGLRMTLGLSRVQTMKSRHFDYLNPARRRRPNPKASDGNGVFLPGLSEELLSRHDWHLQEDGNKMRS